MREAAAVPETFFTIWPSIMERGRLSVGDTILIHGGTSGIGTSAIQLARVAGARVITTSGSDEKCQACRELGADVAINYKTEDFVEVVKRVTGGAGANVILDMVGGDYVNRNYEAAAVEARIVQIAVQRGARSEVDVRRLMMKRLWHTGSTLRPQSVAFKARIATTLHEKLWPLFEAAEDHADHRLDLSARPRRRRAFPHGCGRPYRPDRADRRRGVGPAPDRRPPDRASISGSPARSSVKAIASGRDRGLYRRLSPSPDCGQTLCRSNSRRSSRERFMNTPLMPKATAVWLVDNTSLSFEQIADFCKLHPLEVGAIADGESAITIKGLDPILTGQLTREEIEKAQADPAYRLKMADSKVRVPLAKRRGPRYTPVSRRQDRPNAILWLLRNHPTS